MKPYLKIIITVVITASGLASLVWAEDIPNAGLAVKALSQKTEYAMSPDGTTWKAFANTTGHEVWRASALPGNIFATTGGGVGSLVRMANASMVNPALPRRSLRDANGKLWCETVKNTGVKTFTAYSSLPWVVMPLNASTKLTYYRPNGTTGAATFSRASTATYFDSTGTRQSAAYGVARFGYYYSGSAWVMGGILLEHSATNYLLNSGSPATQTTGSLPTGSYTLWLEGSGSCAIAAGTATGTGWGTATSGSPVNVSITGAGTAVCTVTGTVTAFQLEDKSWGAPTSYIPTTGATVTRARDVLTLPVSGNFSHSAGTVVMDLTLPDVVSTRQPYLLQTNNGGNTIMAILGMSQVHADDGTHSANIFSMSMLANAPERFATTWNTATSTLAVYDVTDGTSATGTYGGALGTGAGLRFDGTWYNLGYEPDGFIRGFRLWNNVALSSAEVLAQ